MAGADRAYRRPQQGLTSERPDDGQVASLSDRWSAGLPFAIVGAASIVAGGLVAAATASAPTEHGTWAAAYLVLVAGVAQICLGVGQALLAPSAPSRRIVAVELAAWNAGNIGVIAGTLLGRVPLVDAGGALLVLSLLFLSNQARGQGRRRSRVVLAYWLLVALVLVSVPIGLVLARLD